MTTPQPEQPAPITPGGQPSIQRQYQGYEPAVPPPPSTNGYAIASLVVSFFGVVGAVISTILGVVALGQIRKTGQQGKGLAIAGLCVSGLWAAGLAIAVTVVILADADRSPYEADRNAYETIDSKGNLPVASLKVGDCIKTIKDSQIVFKVPVGSCSEAHEAEVVGKFQPSGSSYPGEQAIESQAAEQCETHLRFYASDDAIDVVEELTYIYPRASDWQKGSRTIICLALTDPSRTGSLRD